MLLTSTEKLNPATGYTLPVQEKGDIQLALVDDSELGDEGYRLAVEINKIRLEAARPAGIFYGVQTLLQMLPKEVRSSEVQPDANWTIPCAQITDKPRFEWRGLMLDVSRHWFTKEEVMRYIDELAEYKMNVFHWHLTDDQGWRIEIKSLPRLTEVGAWRAERVGDWWSRSPQQPGEPVTYGGYYTQEDIKEVLAYARQRYVRVIPEHLKDEKELQSYFIHRLEGMLKQKGKRLIGWNEILEGGLAPEATVMSWQGMEGGIEAAKAHHHVIMTPTQHCYLDLYQGEPSVEPVTYSMCRLTDCYRFNPVPDSIPEGMVLGAQGNLWSEAVPTFRHAEYMTWPRGWALAEVMWSGPDKTDWNGFWPRVEKHFERAEAANIRYARSMYNAIVTPYLESGELRIKLGCELEDSKIYYTFDNTDPDDCAPAYTEPLRIPKDATRLRVVTYRDGKPSGKVISLTIDELRKRANS